jgi:hypothetical protein
VLPIAFVVINTEIGYMDAVLKEVRVIEGVQEAPVMFSLLTVN